MFIPGADLYAFWCPDHYWKLDWWGFPLSSQFPVTVENKKQQNIGVSTFSFSFLVCLATSSIVFDERGLLTIIRFSWCRQLNIFQISPEICPQYPCIRRGYFFYLEDTVNPLLSPPRAYLFQSLLKGGLMEMEGGGAYLKGGGGLNLFTKIWHHIEFSSNQRMVSVLRKTRTQSGNSSICRKRYCSWKIKTNPNF